MDREGISSRCKHRVFEKEHHAWQHGAEADDQEIYRRRKRLAWALGEDSQSFFDGPGLELLPGIPDDVTLFDIATRLPWRTFHGLSSVGRRWQLVIESHEVRTARVHAHSTETLLSTY